MRKSSTLRMLGKQKWENNINNGYIETIKALRARTKERKELNEHNIQVQTLLFELEQLKSQIESGLPKTESNKLKNKFKIRVHRAQKLIEDRKLFCSNLQFISNNNEDLSQQLKLNLLLDRVKIIPGDALLNLNVAIEGSISCDSKSMVIKESHFISLLHLLETCVLHERIWLSEPQTNQVLRLFNFKNFGPFASVLQSEGILQTYSGIINLTDIQSIKRRIQLYTDSIDIMGINERLIQDIAFSETARMKYIPHTYEMKDFHKFIESIKKQIYEPLLDSIYGKLSESLKSQFVELKNYTRSEEIFIPPISAIILNRASNLDEIPEVALETRKKFTKIRLTLMEYEDSLRDTSISLEKRLKILSDVKLINQELSKPYEYLDSVYLTEWSDAWALFDFLLDGEVSLAKITGKLLGKPLANTIKKLRLHNVAYLFNMRRKVYSIAGHNNLIKKHIPNASINRANFYLNHHAKVKGE